MQDTENLKRAARWVRRQLTKRHDPNSHPSHLAAVVLKEAEEKFGLESFGVEGWADGVGAKGVQYLNFGDPYSPTIIVRSWRHHCLVSFAGGGWEPYA